MVFVIKNNRYMFYIDSSLWLEIINELWRVSE